MTFARQHHQRIAKVLTALNAELLKEHHCLFGGGTAIALSYGEYRESIDIDFLVSELSSYRDLRNLVRERNGIEAIMKDGSDGTFQYSDIRSDQYGIRTKIYVDGQPVKFEIVLEGRIRLAQPGKSQNILGVATLTSLDMATSKLLANSDRGMDMGVHCRDVIDLAMMNLSKPDLHKAVEKAETAYGKAILVDLSKVIDLIQERDGLLERCMEAMDVSVPRALLWQNINKLRAVIAD
jgi:hypothetical protein